ncbi:LysE family translocator [Roseibium polysiphoniae]|uniref:LysE family translocator n=1 Tax=Roseibium polysiphoniae TaxID=2571221 RepID=A0A944CB96_9HYPH|nr:LysE family translocator [Roseibium polysiphoniae]MBS8259264.1 LysE family translocator [Roseibium polysiphoniae]
MDLASLALFATALFLAAGSPGPSIAALVSRVITRGHRDVLPFLAAMWIGEAIWLSCAVWGMSALIETFQPAFVVIKWLGVAYLLFLAWKMWTSPDHIESGVELPKTPPLQMFLSGLAVTLGNPKIMLFYVALLPTIISLKGMTLGSWGSLVAVMIAVLLTIDLIWVFAASQARRLLRNAKAVRLAHRIGAGMMTGTAAAIATR